MTVMQPPHFLMRELAAECRVNRRNNPGMTRYDGWNTNMRLITTATTLFALTLASASAMAAQPMPSNCGSAPLISANDPVTHAQLMRELSALESVGYDPSAEDLDYPTNLNRAQAALQARDQTNCMPDMATTARPLTPALAN
jgi:hypothetical protein